MKQSFSERANYFPTVTINL